MIPLTQFLFAVVNKCLVQAKYGLSSSYVRTGLTEYLDGPVLDIGANIRGIPRSIQRILPLSFDSWMHIHLEVLLEVKLQIGKWKSSDLSVL
jgi:hypothetical protein